MSNCELCGKQMPEGEEMFKYHGLSGPCPVEIIEISQSSTIGNNNLTPRYLSFSGEDNKEIGRFDPSGDRLVFIGDVEESTKVFIEYLLQGFNSRIEQFTKVPEGWKLVPVELTEEMIHLAIGRTLAFRIDVHRTWNDLLDAAPEQSA